MSTTIKMSEGAQKLTALMRFQGEPFFTVKGKVFGGVMLEAQDEYDLALETGYKETFLQWCEENIGDAGEYDEDGDYLVLTDEEADAKAKELILETVWAFTPSFLSDFTGFDEEVFEAIQNNGRCESNNSAILSMIKDEDAFAEEAISADGRGHFLAHYDNVENEVKVNGVTYFIYRIN